MSTKTKNKSDWKFGVAIDGWMQSDGDSYYDRYTTAPHIIAVFRDEAAAACWIEAREAEERRKPLMPGSGWYALYGMYDLSMDQAYMSVQDVEKFSRNIGNMKLALLSRADLVRG